MPRKKNYSNSESSVLADSDPPNDDVKSIEDGIRKAQLQELQDALKYRLWFLIWGVSITSVCVISSVAILVFLTFRGEYETALGVAFVSGLSVEVVGTAVVIAKYLFPNGGMKIQQSKTPVVTEEEDV